MKFNRRIPLLTAGVVVLFLGFVAVTNRYQITVQPGAVVRFDRWTGKLEACNGSGCVPLENPNYKLKLDDVSTPVETSASASGSWRDYATPDDTPVQNSLKDAMVVMTLFDGTELKFPPKAQPKMRATVDRITTCKKSAQSWEASDTCARPPVEDQLAGTGYFVGKDGTFDATAKFNRTQ